MSLPLPSSSFPSTSPCNAGASAASSLSPSLERLPPDLSALVLSHLSVQELAQSLSLVSKSMCRACRAPALWRIKFQARWPNAKSSSSSSSVLFCCKNVDETDASEHSNNSWYISYQRAYRHPHDLWITHWNCVYPNDALSPGRCCIIPPPLSPVPPCNNKQKHDTTMHTDVSSSSSSSLCPTCRFGHRQHHTNLFQTAWQDEVQYQRRRRRRRQHVLPQHYQQLEDPIKVAQQRLRDDDHNTTRVAFKPTTTTTTTTKPTKTTPAKQMALSTQYFLAKACRRLYQEFCNGNNDDDNVKTARIIDLLTTGQQSHDNDDDDDDDDNDSEDYRDQPHDQHHSHFHLARLAFEKAATFHRRILPEQYRTDRLCFLQDVLFFNVTSNSMEDWTRPGDVEHYNLRYDVYGRPQSVDNDSDEDDDDDEQDHNIAAAAAAIHPRHSTTTVTNYFEYETAHHSWHVVQFSNPDLCRPISFRIFIQRSDCFAVYPSEGYLSPGESCAVVFSVRPMGSLLCEAFDALNVHREGVDPFLGNVYTEEAHLPYAPFCIRYMYAPMTPCVPPNYYSSSSSSSSQAGNVMSLSTATVPWVPHPPPTASSSNNNSKEKQHFMMDHMWENVATEADIRTIYLSAHVVGHNYPFLDFQRATLTPFCIRQGPSNDDVVDDNHGGNDHATRRHKDHPLQQQEPLVLVAPELQSKDPLAFSILNNMRFEVEMSPAAENYRTEPPCERCGQRWGLRMEELGHAYVVGRMECIAHAARRHATIRNVVVCVRQVQEIMMAQQQQYDPRNIVLEVETLERILQLLCIVHSILHQYKTFPLITAAQLKLLVKLECKVDEFCVRASTEFSTRRQSGFRNSLGKTWIPWRHSGVYPYLTCTDSIFNPSQKLRGLTLWKEEPNYLEAFRHLAHSPGRYCLGPREDPNHPGETSCSKKSLYYRRQFGCVTDVFMDDQVCAMECAVCMLHDPRSLLVHGIYDRVFAGSVARRPKLPLDILSFLVDSEECDAIISENGAILANKTLSCHYPLWNQVVARRTAYYELQDALDLRSLCIGDNSSLYHSVSVRRYIRNIPSPGRGQYGLSNESDHDHIESDRAISIVRWDPHNSLGGELFPSVSNATGSGVSQPNHPEIDHHAHAPSRQIPLVNPEGPRIHNLLGVLSAHLGWTVDESQGAGLVFVDRRILIATQMVSISLMIVPMLASLLARCSQWIPTQPITYHLEDMPFALDTEMRYLSERECGYLAAMVVLAWLFLVRRTERKTGRDFFRVMLEHVSPEAQDLAKLSFFARAGIRVINWSQRRWDATCPLFLQRLVFIPKWNRRTESDLIDHIATCRSKDLREHRNEFKALGGRGKMLYDQISTSEGVESSALKLIVSAVVASGSFCASSPHFVLNLLTVFCCSIGLGLSLSLHSMEVGRNPLHEQHAGSRLRRYSLVTMIIFSFLIGQLVGCSGGVLFLAEFVVTSTSLLLGGAGTISASAIESWGCFFCLSSAAFWGYLCARVALMDGILHKRGGFSSTMLCSSIVAALGLLIATFLFWQWETAPALMIVLPRMDKRAGADRKFQRMARNLQ